MAQETCYCDDCGDPIGKNFFTITHISHDINSANAGESAILCYLCNCKLLAKQVLDRSMITFTVDSYDMLVESMAETFSNAFKH